MKFAASILGVGLSVALLASVPAAADTALGGNTNALASAFNAQAKSMGLDQRIARSKCDTGKIEVCTYSGGEDITIMASSKEGADDLASLMVVFGSKNPNGLHLIATLGAMMAMYSPQAEADERGVIFSKLLAGLKENDGKAEAYLDGTKYSASAIPDMGLWVTISRP